MNIKKLVKNLGVPKDWRKDCRKAAKKFVRELEMDDNKNIEQTHLEHAILNKAMELLAKTILQDRGHNCDDETFWDYLRGGLRDVKDYNDVANLVNEAVDFFVEIEEMIDRWEEVVSDGQEDAVRAAIVERKYETVQVSNMLDDVSRIEDFDAIEVYLKEDGIEVNFRLNYY